MNNFWDNLIRYPRFFISSLSGSIITILYPFRKGLKKKKWRGLITLSIISFILFLFITLKTMTGF